MRECGTARADAATDGTDFVCGLDTLENRRCWNAESRQNRGVYQVLIVLESLRSASWIEDSDDALLRIHHPDGSASVSKVKLDLALQVRRRFGGYNLDGEFG